MQIAGRCPLADGRSRARRTPADAARPCPSVPRARPPRSVATTVEAAEGRFRLCGSDGVAGEDPLERVIWAWGSILRDVALPDEGRGVRQPVSHARASSSRSTPTVTSSCDGERRAPGGSAPVDANDIGQRILAARCAAVGATFWAHRGDHPRQVCACCALLILPVQGERSRPTVPGWSRARTTHSAYACRSHGRRRPDVVDDEAPSRWKLATLRWRNLGDRPSRVCGVKHRDGPDFVDYFKLCLSGSPVTTKLLERRQTKAQNSLTISSSRPSLSKRIRGVNAEGRAF